MIDIVKRSFLFYIIFDLKKIFFYLWLAWYLVRSCIIIECLDCIFFSPLSSQNPTRSKSAQQLTPARLHKVILLSFSISHTFSFLFVCFKPLLKMSVLICPWWKKWPIPQFRWALLDLPRIFGFMPFVYFKFKCIIHSQGSFHLNQKKSRCRRKQFHPLLICVATS